MTLQITSTTPTADPVSTLLTTTVGQLVTERPSRSRLFESFGIDYCCGGKKPLEVAAVGKGLDPRTVASVLLAFDEQSPSAEPDWSTASLTDLADHIEKTHHAYLKTELPRLDFLTDKVARRHGEHAPNLVELRDLFVSFKAELEHHMFKEEQILFPLCRAMDEGNASAAAAHCGSVKNPIRVMVQEHDDAGDALARMRTLTNNFTPPADACNTYRALFDALAYLEYDMHRHVHKENSILFPAAAEAEARLLAQG